MSKQPAALGCETSDLAQEDSARWLVISPGWHDYLADVAKMAAVQPGVVWVPNDQFAMQLEDFELYDDLDQYDWAGAEIWEMLHDNPAAYRAIRLIPTGETAGGVSQYAVVEERLLRDWMIDTADPEYERMHEVVCLYGWRAYNPNLVGEYGSGGYSHAQKEASKAVEVLREVGGFYWLFHHLECMGSMDPYVALAVRPHIGQRIDQQCYDALRRGFEAQRGELLHPDDRPLPDIRYLPAGQSGIGAATPGTALQRR